MSFRSTAYAILLFTLTTVFLAYEMAVQVAPGVISDNLMGHFHIDAAGFGLMSSTFFFAYTLMQIPGGILMDRFNIRYVLSAAIAFTAVGSWLFAMLLDPFTAALGRFLVGVGGAMAYVGTLTVARQRFSADKFDVMAGITQFVAAFGAMLGAEPLAIANEMFGWKETLHGLGLIGFIIVVAFFIVARDNRSPSEREDSESFRDQLKKLMTLLRSVKNYVLALYAFLNWGPIMIFAALWGIPFFKATLGVTATHAAQDVSLCWIGNACAGPLFGWMANRFNCHHAILKYAPLIGLLVSMFLLTFNASTPEYMVVLAMLTIGAMSSAHILTFGIACDSNPPSLSATALAFINMAVVAGGALLQPLVGTVLSDVWSGQLANGVPIYSAHEYRLTMLSLPICYACGVIIAMVLKMLNTQSEK